MFSREFYGALAAGLPVDAAVCEARKAIFTQVNAVEWATPVLYMRSRDGRIFDVQTQDEPPPLEIDEPEDADDTDIRVDLPPEVPDPERVIDISRNEGPAPEDPVPKSPKRDRPAVAVAAALERLSSDPHGPQRYRLLLDNAGRETTEVHLRAQDPNQALILDLSNESVLLPPGQETTTELVVRARGRAWTAQSHEYPFNVVIEPEGDSPKVVRGVLVRPPTITRVRAALAALVVVIVLAGLGLFLFRPHPVETGGGGGGGGGAGGQLTGIAYIRGSDIYITGSGSGPGDNLTADIDGDCRQPAWSQDGEWVAFSVSRDGESVIYGVRVADGLEVQLPSPSSPPSDTDPAISPDGTLLAFISGPPHQRHLYVAKADGTGSATLIDQGNDTRPAWSPDGQRIVFHRSLNGVAGLATIPAGGGEAHQFTTDPDDQSPSWTPSDGILFHSRRGGECCSLFIFDPDGSSVLPLHVGGAEPSWSPDGQSFAFHRGSEVWVADADGSNLRKILDAGSGNPDPAW
jgi:Tol biopolymer transport system component